MEKDFNEIKEMVIDLVSRFGVVFTTSDDCINIYRDHIAYEQYHEYMIKHFGVSEEELKAILRTDKKELEHINKLVKLSRLKQEIKQIENDIEGKYLYLNTN